LCQPSALCERLTAAANVHNQGDEAVSDGNIGILAVTIRGPIGLISLS